MASVPPNVVFNVSTANVAAAPSLSPSTFLNAAATVSTFAPARYERPSDWSLTEPLIKPLHHFDESELKGLVDELVSRGYEEREEQITKLTCEMTMEIMDQRKGGKHRGAAGHISYCEAAYVQHKSSTYSRTTRIRVAIPEWLPDYYVKAFIDRMIRDQIEEE